MRLEKNGRNVIAVEKDIGLGESDMIDKEARFEGFWLRCIEETNRQI